MRDAGKIQVRLTAHKNLTRKTEHERQIKELEAREQLAKSLASNSQESENLVRKFESALHLRKKSTIAEILEKNKNNGNPLSDSLAAAVALTSLLTSNEGAKKAIDNIDKLNEEDMNDEERSKKIDEEVSLFNPGEKYLILVAAKNPDSRGGHHSGHNKNKKITEKKAKELLATNLEDVNQETSELLIPLRSSHNLLIKAGAKSTAKNYHEEFADLKALIIEALSKLKQDGKKITLGNVVECLMFAKTVNLCHVGQLTGESPIDSYEAKARLEVHMNTDYYLARSITICGMVIKYCANITSVNIDEFINTNLDKFLEFLSKALDGFDISRLIEQIFTQIGNELTKD